MKTIRFVLFLLASIWLAAPANAATPDERLIGAWEELTPPFNVIQFFSDYTLKLYLTKEEGEQQDPPARYISGTWSIRPDGESYILVMHLTHNERSLERDIQLIFDGKEMVLLDDTSVETRHRRLIGQLPEKYVW